jgi:hypothetical protein
MDPKALAAIVDAHGKYLRNEAGGVRANLTEANLTEANLHGANLSMAYLTEANLYRANLSMADLSEANLHGANLSMADLSGANLHGANLSRANLHGANLSRANLSMADLSGTYLPAPTVMLLALWTEVGDDLCRDLMRWDAMNHPDPRAFQRWAEGGPCPYTGVGMGRAAHFQERKELFSLGPCPTPYALLLRCFAENNVTHTLPPQATE